MKQNILLTSLASLLMLGFTSQANIIETGTFTGTVAQGDGHYSIGNSVSGTFSYGTTASDDSFVVDINGNPYFTAIFSGSPAQSSIGVNTGGIPSSEGRGTTAFDTGPEVTLFYLNIVAEPAELVFNEGSYPYANLWANHLSWTVNAAATPDASSSLVLLSTALVSLGAARRFLARA